MSSNRPGVTLFIASLATLATFLDTTVLYVAFPAISATFVDTDAASLSWVLNAYTIVFAAVLIPAGKLADRLGHRRVFLIGSAVFTVASMVCGLAPTAEVLIVFRMVKAVGAAALIPSSLALVMHAYPRDRLPQAVAIWGAAGGVAGALGPTLGSLVIETLGWRWAFFINLPVGVVTVAVGLRVLRESSDARTPIPSLLGVGLIAAAAATLSYGVVGSGRAGWAGTSTVVALIGGTLLLALFVAHQRRTSAPALNLELFSIGDVRWGSLAMFVFGIAFSAMFFGSILFLTDVWGWSILQAGLGVAPGPALVAVLAPNAGRLAAKIGQRPLLLAGGVLYAGAGLHRIVALGPEADYVRDYLPSILLSGVAVALCIPQLSSVVAQALPANRIGIGGATLQAVRQFGGTFGVALTIALLAGSSAGSAAGATARTPSGLDALPAFRHVWWIIVIGGLTTSLLCWPLQTLRLQRRVVAPTSDSPRAM